MSNTYTIVCDDCKVRLWIGQENSAGDLYIYNGETLMGFSQFLYKHKYHNIRCLDEHAWDDMADYLPFKHRLIADKSRLSQDESPLKAVIEQKDKEIAALLEGINNLAVHVGKIVR